MDAGGGGRLGMEGAQQLDQRQAGVGGDQQVVPQTLRRRPGQQGAGGARLRLGA